MAVSFYSTTGFTAQEVMRIGSDGNIGIGTAGPSSKMSMQDYNEYIDILKLAETNPAVKSALDKLKTTYYLSKDNGSET